MKTTQKGGFSKLCGKIKKRCYTGLRHFSARKQNLGSFCENKTATYDIMKNFNCN
jgi:hypothetical protein